MNETLRELNRILASALKELAKAGEGEKDKACQLAANAWSVLRDVDPKEAERMNGLLHQLTATACSCRSAADESSAMSDFDLEVRHLPPAKRHELIFETFQRLQAGQGFILINDHDPKPLYYQLAFEHPGAFTWTPIESGPEVWRVRIGKP